MDARPQIDAFFLAESIERTGEDVFIGNPKRGVYKFNRHEPVKLVGFLQLSLSPELEGDFSIVIDVLDPELRVIGSNHTIIAVQPRLFDAWRYSQAFFEVNVLPVENGVHLAGLWFDGTLLQEYRLTIELQDQT